MIHFVGAGPGAEDLITVRGQRLLREADVIIYAGSLVNPGLLKEAGEACRIYNSAVMTLEEVIAVMKQAEAEGLKTCLLYTSQEARNAFIPCFFIQSPPSDSRCRGSSRYAACHSVFSAAASSLPSAYYR